MLAVLIADSGCEYDSISFVFALSFVSFIHQNDIVSTSMRRDHVASTLIRRHFNIVCLLG